MSMPTQPPAAPLAVAAGAGDIPRTCPACGRDARPAHVVVGGRLESQQATLPDGTKVPVRVPVDIAYHHECHAGMGCHHCQEVLDANGGSTLGKEQLTTPDGHQSDVAEPHEFEQGSEGVLTRVRSNAEAKQYRLSITVPHTGGGPAPATQEA